MSIPRRTMDLKRRGTGSPIATAGNSPKILGLPSMADPLLEGTHHDMMSIISPIPWPAGPYRATEVVQAARSVGPR